MPTKESHFYHNLPSVHFKTYLFDQIDDFGSDFVEQPESK